MHPRKFLVACFVILLVSVLLFGCEKKTQEITFTTKSPEALKLFVEGLERYDLFYHPEAFALFERAVAADPEFAMAWYYWAHTSPNAADYQKRLKKAIALADNVSEPEWLIIMSAKARNEDKAALARHHMEQLVSLLPRSKRAHLTLGSYYYGLHDWELAEKEFRAAIDVDPDFAPPYNMLGYLLSNKGEYSEAIKALEKYAALRPQDPNPHDSMGEIYLWMSDHKSSVKEFSRSLELDPRFVASRAGIGHNHVFKGEFDQARARYDEMLEYARSVADTNMGFFWKAISYVHEGKPHKAVETLEEQLEFAKAHNDIYMQASILGQIAMIYLDVGDFSKALNAVKTVREMCATPGFETGVREEYLRACAFMEAVVSAREGRKDQAQPLMDEFWASAEASGHPVAMKVYHSLRGLVAYWSNDYETAIAELTQGDPENPYARYYLALSYEKSGQQDQAKETFSEIAKYNRNSIYYAFVRAPAMEKL